MWLVCLVSLPLLDIHTSDILSDIIIVSSSVTISGSLLKNPWINILKCARAIPAVNAELYSIYTLDWETDPGTFVPCSIDPPWKNIMYDPVLLPVSGQSYQIE